ncbi:40S ribosomal protein S11 [Iris pallida]|uniref:40S ribosomal protein S11 n=1 Tax=Iris pallida TaxID=29817 RepID=A0AAX6GUA1_IRIPA|nr:40S ribosomal protein S11 [Iris pallida]
MAEQTEKAFLKQSKVFFCSKKSSKGKRPGIGGNRFWKSVRLGFKTPEPQLKVLTLTRSVHLLVMFSSEDVL